MSLSPASAALGASIVAQSITHQYKGPTDTLTVVDNVTFTVPAGGYLAMTGQSGAGKSTLLALLGGLERPQIGALTVGETELGALNRKNLAGYRSGVVGFVFQHFGLLESLTAAENVELACTLHRTGKRERRKRVNELLDAVQLSHRTAHRPLHLSGGERQRVAIARALANDPKLVLADEPTGNLDEESAHIVIELLEQIVRERGTTLVVVTHNSEVAARANQHLRLERGRVVDLT